jgi:WD40 repeat protein
MINVYKNLEFDEFGKLKNPIDLFSTKKLNAAMITDIIVLEKQKLIAACDLEGLITLWYLQNYENKDKLQEPEYGHRKSVLSLASLEEKNWLLSCGTEHFVMVWDLVVGKHVGMLQGHSQSLIGVRVLQGTNQIITGDVSGIFKVWDNRDLSLVQTFSIPNNGNKKANTFTLTSLSKKKIIVGSDKVYFFDYEESQEGNLADSKVCICVLYNEIFNIFVTAHIDCIKIWDAEKGLLKQVFRDITSAEISCVKFDQRKRKLFIGDVEGHVLLINILNGVQMKYFNKHKDYISSLAYYSEGKKFISASWDGFIKIHDDDSPDEKGLQLFELSHNNMGRVNSCNTLDFSEEMKILASGYDNGIVTLMNMKSLSSEGTLTDHKKVTLVSFLGDYPAVVVCDQEGVIHFWSLVLTKPKKLLRDLKIENLSNNENHTKEYFPVKTLCFEKQSNILLVGDETGYVKAFNIKEYIDYLKLMLPCAKIEYSDIAHIQSTSKEISPELKKLKEELLKAPKYDATKEEGFKYTISLGDLIRIKNSMNLEPILEKEWLAHKHGITSVCCHSEPVFFVTAGHDMKVHIWNRKFERIGSLITMTDPKWNVKINIEEERRKAREEAKEKFYALKDLDYESLFEGETKLPRLIDDD